LLGDDLIGIDVRAVERRDFTFMFAEWLHSLSSSSVSSSVKLSFLCG
jgi:hypothetical protein